MSIFVGKSFTKVEDVRSKYSAIDCYDMSDGDNQDINCEVVLKDDFHNCIRQIESDVCSIIKTLESYDLASGIDELKILAEKLY